MSPPANSESIFSIAIFRSRLGGRTVRTASLNEIIPTSWFCFKLFTISFTAVLTAISFSVFMEPLVSITKIIGPSLAGAPIAGV